METENYNIRYYIKSLENPLFKDITAWHIWDFCLLMAFPKGSFTCGREQMQEWTGVKGTTAYHALKRLENAKMVTTSVTGGLHHRHTVISIVNWAKYQPQLYRGSDSLIDNPVTTNRQPSDNPVTHYDKEIGNKKEERKRERELTTEEIKGLTENYPDLDKRYEYEQWKDNVTATGKELNTHAKLLASFRMWLRNSEKFRQKKVASSLDRKNSPTNNKNYYKEWNAPEVDRADELSPIITEMRKKFR